MHSIFGESYSTFGMIQFFFVKSEAELRNTKKYEMGEGGDGEEDCVECELWRKSDGRLGGWLFGCCSKKDLLNKIRESCESILFEHLTSINHCCTIHRLHCNISKSQRTTAVSILSLIYLLK